jgi:hypothetical protein
MGFEAGGQKAGASTRSLLSRGGMVCMYERDARNGWTTAVWPAGTVFSGGGTAA